MSKKISREEIAGVARIKQFAEFLNLTASWI
jgi:hypothetical protein